MNKTTSYAFDDVWDLEDLRAVVASVSLWPGEARVDLSTGNVAISYEAIV